MVELRKRKAVAEPVPAPGTKKNQTASKKATPKVEAADANGSAAAESKAASGDVGDVVTLEGFGGEIVTNDGDKTSLQSLVDASKSGVVLFTYPKASTPGCTKQVCLFRDGYEHLTSTGLSIYGLSTDSPKANTTFKTKQELPYPLLCDPSATLIGAIGFKKSPKGTVRGVFVVDKKGKVLLREAGGPAATVDAVQKLVVSSDAGQLSTSTDQTAENDTVTAKEPVKPAKSEKVEKDSAGDEKEDE